MQNEKRGNKTLRICGVGSVRKNKGKGGGDARPLGIQVGDRV